MAVVVDNAASAIVPIIELRPVPMSITGLAACAEHVAPNINVAAALDVGTARYLASAPSRTLQLAAVVDDFAIAVVEMVERTPAPIAVAGVAFSLKPVATNTDVAAGLLVRSSRRAVPVPVSVTISISITAAVAPELPVDVADPVPALVVVIKITIGPIATPRLAAGAKRISLDTDVSARLRVIA